MSKKQLPLGGLPNEVAEVYEELLRAYYIENGFLYPPPKEDELTRVGKELEKLSRKSGVDLSPGEVFFKIAEAKIRCFYYSSDQEGNTYPQEISRDDILNSGRLREDKNEKIYMSDLQKEAYQLFKGEPGAERDNSTLKNIYILKKNVREFKKALLPQKDFNKDKELVSEFELNILKALVSVLQVELKKTVQMATIEALKSRKTQIINKDSLKLVWLYEKVATIISDKMTTSNDPTDEISRLMQNNEFKETIKKYLR